MASTPSGPELSAATSEVPLVSIGLPVHNGAEHLAEALESVLRQDYPSLEVIVCDNASEDETESIARRYAEASPQVRYVRNLTNIGFLPNFRRVLEEARGVYFTWLAHDDVLHDPSYITTLVRYLELHPEAVACSSSFKLLEFELADSAEVKEFPELSPERWPKSRCELFRWPHGWIDLMIYGVYRRFELVQFPIRERVYRGGPHLFWWETDLLTQLSAVGPIVALPQCLRSYRRSTTSVGQKVVANVSTFDLLILGSMIKLILIARAVRLPVPLTERVPLLATTLANLLRANLRQPYDHRAEIRRHERELAMLERVAEERFDLIRSLTSTVNSRRKAVAEKRGVLERSADLLPELPEPTQLEHRRPAGKKPSRSFLDDFFHPPLDSQIEYFRQMNERIQELRAVCDAQLRTIEELDSEAASLLRAIDMPDPSPRA